MVLFGNTSKKKTTIKKTIATSKKKTREIKKIEETQVAVSPAQSCKNETLRFAQRAKNKAVVNEQLLQNDDVNTLKRTGNQVDGCATGRSISLLEFSPHYPMVLPHIDDDGDVEMEIVEQILDRKDMDVVNMQQVAAVQNLETNEEDTVKDASTQTGLDSKPLLAKKDAGVQAVLQGHELEGEKPVVFLCRNCSSRDCSNLQLVPVEKNKQQAVEKVLAGAISREMALEELCTRQDAEINQLNRLLEQYKHERECNGRIREDKIARLESLMDGILTAEEYKANELVSLKNENKILKEIQHLRTQLQLYMDSWSKRNNALQMTYPPLSTIQDQKSEAESKWISLVEDLELKLQESRFLVEKQKHELDMERKCAKDAMQMAMEGHAKMLELYADLEEKHINLLTTQHRIEDGIIDVKKAAAKAGVKGAESKFINALAAEISILKAENEKERRYYRDESNRLKAQLRDTDEALVAAGERLKEAEEAIAAAEARRWEAEQEKEKAYKEIEYLKKKKLNDSSASNMPTYDCNADQQWKDEFDKLSEPSSWLSGYGYDICNI